MIAKILCLLICWTSIFWMTLANAEGVRVLGMFTGAVIIEIDGKRVLIKEGKTGPRGVKLIKVDGIEAILRVNGQEQTFTLSSHTPSTSKNGKPESITIKRDPDGHYYSVLEIIGKKIGVIIDTGASGISMSELHAKTLGIKYLNGEQVNISTAGGKIKGYRIKIAKVSLQGIEVQNVDVIIHKGSSPTIVLLGMSFLKKVNYSNKENALSISKK